MAEQTVFRVVDKVPDSNGHIGWVVVATFADGGQGVISCVDYQVRALPIAQTKTHAELFAREAEKELQAEAEGREYRAMWDLVTSDPPRRGIPNRVLEAGSQARLLSKVRRKARQSPRTLDRSVLALIEAEHRPKPGRPPKRTLAEKVQILADVEQAQTDKIRLDVVAGKHGMSRSSLRDLIGWARHVAQPALLERTAGSGHRNARLTAEARRLLDMTGER